MFGYVTFYKDELKIKDYTKFRAYYCGLCKELGKSFNQLVRLGLSYDFTFLSVLLDSLDDEQTEFSNEGCLKHLGKKRPTVCSNPSLKYCADMSVLFMYYKLLDDWTDDHSLISLFAMIPYWFSVRKIYKKYPLQTKILKENLKKLSCLEKGKCKSVDETSHAFAEIMETLFDKGDNDLKRLGYNIGRFIYIADAVNDYETDVKKGKYNPFVYAYPDLNFEQIKENANRSMLITLSMASENYENLKIQKNKELLDNIIYMGLRHQMETAGSEKDKKGRKNGKSI